TSALVARATARGPYSDIPDTRAPCCRVPALRNRYCRPCSGTRKSASTLARLAVVLVDRAKLLQQRDRVRNRGDARLGTVGHVGHRLALLRDCVNVCAVLDEIHD